MAGGEQRNPGVAPVQGQPTTYPTPPTELTLAQTRPYASNYARALYEIDQWIAYARENGWNVPRNGVGPTERISGQNQSIQPQTAELVRQRLIALNAFTDASFNFLRTHGWRYRGGTWENIPITGTTHWDWWNRFPIVTDAPSYPILPAGLEPRRPLNLAPPAASIFTPQFTYGEPIARVNAQPYIDQYVRVYAAQQDLRDRGMRGGWVIAGQGNPELLRGFVGTRLTVQEANALRLEWLRYEFFTSNMRFFLQDHGWVRSSANPSQWQAATITPRPGGLIQNPPTLPVSILLARPAAPPQALVLTPAQATSYGPITTRPPLQIGNGAPLMITWVPPSTTENAPAILPRVGPAQIAPGIYQYWFTPGQTRLDPGRYGSDTSIDYSVVSAIGQFVRRSSTDAMIASARLEGTVGNNLPQYNPFRDGPISPISFQYNNTTLLVLEGIIERNLSSNGRNLRPYSQWIPADLEVFEAIIGNRQTGPITARPMRGNLASWTPQALLNPANNDALVYILGRAPSNYETWSDYYAAALTGTRGSERVPAQTQLLLRNLGNTPTGQPWGVWFNNQIRNFGERNPFMPSSNIYNTQFLTNPNNHALMTTLLGPMSNYPVTAGFRNWAEYWQSVTSPTPLITTSIPGLQQLRPLPANIGSAALTRPLTLTERRPNDPLSGSNPVIPQPPRVPPSLQHMYPGRGTLIPAQPATLPSFMLPSNPCLPQTSPLQPYGVNLFNLQYTIRNLTVNFTPPGGGLARPVVVGRSATAVDPATGRLIQLLRVREPRTNQIVMSIIVRGPDGRIIEQANVRTPTGPTPPTQPPAPVVTFRGYASSTLRSAGLQMLANAIGNIVGAWVENQIRQAREADRVNEYITRFAYGNIMSNVRANPNWPSVQNPTQGPAKFYEMTDPTSTCVYNLYHGNNGMAAANWMGFRQSTSLLADLWRVMKTSNNPRLQYSFVNCANFMGEIFEHFELNSVELWLQRIDRAITGDNVLWCLQYQTYFNYLCAGDWDRIKALRYLCVKNESTARKAQCFESFRRYYFNSKMWNKSEMAADLNFRHPPSRTEMTSKFDYMVRELDGPILSEEIIVNAAYLRLGEFRYGALTRNLMRVNMAATYISWFIFTLNDNQPTEVTQVLDLYRTRCQELQIAMLDYLDQVKYGLVRESDLNLPLGYVDVLATKLRILVKEGIAAINSLPPQVRTWNEWRVFHSVDGPILEWNTFGSGQLATVPGTINPQSHFSSESTQSTWMRDQWQRYEYYILDMLEIPKPSDWPSDRGSWEAWWTAAKEEGIADGRRTLADARFRHEQERYEYQANVDRLAQSYAQMNPGMSQLWVHLRANADPQSLRKILLEQIDREIKFRSQICWNDGDCNCVPLETDTDTILGTLRRPTTDVQNLPIAEPIPFGNLNGRPIYMPVGGPQSALDGVANLTALINQAVIGQMQMAAALHAQMDFEVPEAEDSDQEEATSLPHDLLASFNTASVKPVINAFKSIGNNYGAEILNSNLHNNLSDAFPIVGNGLLPGLVSDKTTTVLIRKPNADNTLNLSLSSLEASLGLTLPKNVTSTSSYWNDRDICICRSTFISSLAYGAIAVTGSDMADTEHNPLTDCYGALKICAVDNSDETSVAGEAECYGAFNVCGIDLADMFDVDTDCYGALAICGVDLIDIFDVDTESYGALAICGVDYDETSETGETDCYGALAICGIDLIDSFDVDTDCYGALNICGVEIPGIISG